MVDRIVPRGAPGAPRLSVSKCRGALAWTHACSPAPAGRVCTVERATSAPAPVGPVRRESMTAWRVRAHHYLAARAPAAPAAPEQRARTRDAARLSSGSSVAPASSAARASAAAAAGAAGSGATAGSALSRNAASTACDTCTAPGHGRISVSKANHLFSTEQACTIAET